jgi:hypothetical protein
VESILFVALVDIAHVNGLDRKASRFIPERERYFSLLQNVQTRYRIHSAMYPIDTQCYLPSHGVKLTTHHHLRLRLRMHGAIYPIFHIHIS